MITYRSQGNFTEIPLPTMSWSFDDDEHADVKGFSCPYPTPSPRQYLNSPLVLPGVALSEQYTCSPHVNPNDDCTFDTLFLGQVHTFLPNTPYHNGIGRALHPVQQQQQLHNRQFDHEMAVIYQPISSASDYRSHIVRSNDDEFTHINHPSPESEMLYLHQPSPVYLPPTSVLFDHNLCPPPDSPLSTPFHSPTKQEEEEYMDRISEVFTSPLRFSAEPAETFMSQDIDEEDEGDLQEPNQNYLDMQLGRQLPTPILVSDDIDRDKTSPYAVLIHRALMSTPTRRMVLSEIYKYFREKIPRFRKVKGRGWMNSIRHNLSMNGAFLKEDRPPGDPGKGYIWVLSEEAEREGVKSTTRYRKSPPNSKKRSTDETFLRGTTGRRRRKSTRKWTTVKPRSHSESTMTLVGDEQHEREPTLPPPPPPPTSSIIQYEIPASPHTDFIHGGYNYNLGDCLEFSDRSVTPDSGTTLDYSNCYHNFSHFGASHLIYNSEEEDDWCFSGSAAGDQFSEEYTLVTQD